MISKPVFSGGNIFGWKGITPRYLFVSPITNTRQIFWGPTSGAYNAAAIRRAILERPAFSLRRRELT